MPLADTARRILARYGAPMTLWRQTQTAGANDWTKGAPADAFYACQARERGSMSYVMKGTLTQDERLVVIDAATLAVPPRKGDKIAAGTHTANTPGTLWHLVTAVDPPRYGAGPPVYRCKVTA